MKLTVARPSVPRQFGPRGFNTRHIREHLKPIKKKLTSDSAASGTSARSQRGTKR